MKQRILAIFLLLILTGNCSIYAAANYNYQPATINPTYNGNYQEQSSLYPQNNTLKGNVTMVPAGVAINSSLTAPLSSEFSMPGQAVTLALNNDFYYDNKLIAPAGSTVYGTVIEASSAKHGSINGRLCVRFTQINTPFGAQIPISAVIKTEDSTGVLVGGTKMDVTKEYAKDLTVGSGAGALTGLVFGAIAGGSVGKAAAIGTAIGAGGGLVKSIADKGHDVNIPANANIDIVLTQPITVSTSTYQYEN